MEFEALGPQKVKNIAEPVEAFRRVLDEAPGVAPTRSTAPRAKRWIISAAAAVVLIAGGGYWLWDNWWRFERVEAASLELMAFPLPERSSIAVIGFENMSGDPEQEFFSDGISEDVITDLSKISGLFVIARQSSFRYKGKDICVKQIGRELGATYVLECSVRKADLPRSRL